MTVRSTRASGVVMMIASTIAVVATLAACADEEILLATVPPTPPGGPPGGTSRRCIETSECDASSFCARVGCGDLGGTCEPRPVVCEEAAAPVCGCDGVTYFNDCLRRASGATAMTPGECTTTALACGGGGPGGPGPSPGGPPPDPTMRCPPGAFCARLLPPPLPGPMPPDSCPPDAPGRCWALPAACPPSGGPDRWIACGPAGGACRTTCDAIRTGEPHRRALACP